MLRGKDDEAAIKAAIGLTEEIAREAPECAAKALQIISLLEGVSAGPDQGTVQDVIGAEMLETDVPELTVRATATSVVRALKT